MKRGLWIFAIVTALLIGAGSFWATRAVGQGDTARTRPGAGRARRFRPGRVARWLGLTAEQAKALRQADPTFDTEAAELRTQLTGRRKTFAQLLENDESSDQQLLQQLDKVIETQSRLERRVTQHLLKVRRLLTPQQRRRLLGLAASGVRRHGAGRRGRSPRTRPGPGAQTRPGQAP